MHYNKTHTFTLFLEELISIPENVVNFSDKCTWCWVSHTAVWWTIINNNETTFLLSIASQLSNILPYNSDPPQKFNGKPAFMKIPSSAVLSDGKPRNCWDPAVGSHQWCVTWWLIHGNLFGWCESVALLSFLLTCRAYDSLPSETIMARQLVANKDWLFSVGVSELISWQTLHQWIYHIYKRQTETCARYMLNSRLLSIARSVLLKYIALITLSR